MGKNYYLSTGYNVKSYWKCKLEKIEFDEEIKSLEQIFMLTSSFDNIYLFKEWLYSLGLIDSYNEDVVIACNKTDKKTNIKRLVPIYLKRLIFKEDLLMLGLNAKNFKELATELWNYIKKRQNDKTFMNYILDCYLEKYSSSKSGNILIYENGDISLLKKCVNDSLYAEESKDEYQLCFANFFRNELFSCDVIKQNMKINEKEKCETCVFKPKDGKINSKGLHDMLVNIITYVSCYEHKYSLKSVSEDEEIERDEEFLEPRDYDIMLKNYAKDENVQLDLEDEIAVSCDEFATSIIETKLGLIKSYGGID